MSNQDVDLPAETKAALDAVALLSRKWHPTVLVVLADQGPIGFNDLLEAIPTVSGKVLSDTLDRLVEADLVVRTVVSESPLRVEYDLTQAGSDFERVFDAFSTWANRHLESTAPTILVADGDRRLTGMYGRWLSEHYTSRRAHNGEQFEARLDEEVDVVIVAESVPGIDPERMQAVVRPDCQVVLVVEERPDFDVLAVECDGVVRKPIVREQLFDVVEEQLSRQGASPEVREHGALASKRSLLTSIYSPETLAGNDDYVALCSRLEALEDRIEE